MPIEEGFGVSLSSKVLLEASIKNPGCYEAGTFHILNWGYNLEQIILEGSSTVLI